MLIQGEQGRAGLSQETLPQRRAKSMCIRGWVSRGSSEPDALESAGTLSPLILALKAKLHNSWLVFSPSLQPHLPSPQMLMEVKRHPFPSDETTAQTSGHQRKLSSADWGPPLFSYRPYWMRSEVSDTLNACSSLPSLVPS